MGRIYGNTTTPTGRIYSTSSLDSSKTKKPGVLERVFSFLNAGETAPGVYASLTGKNPLEAQVKATKEGLSGKGIYTKQTYEDVLNLLGWQPKTKVGKVARAGTGIGLDILLDPTTYFGGAIAKNVVKPVVKFAGESVTKIPKLGTRLKSAYELAEELAVPGAKIKRLGVKGEEFWNNYLQFIKKTRADEFTTVADFAKLRKGAEALGMKGSQLSELIEKGTKLSGQEKKAADTITDFFSKWAKEEKSRGLLKTEIGRYVPHILTPEAKESKAITELAFGQIPKPLRINLGSSKPRKILDTIKSINDWSVENYGYKLFQEDIFNIAAERGVKHVKAIKVYDFVQDAGKKFGIDNVEDVSSKTVDGILYTKSTAPSLEKVLLPAPIAEHLDETYKALTNDKSINQILKVYDKALGIWKGSVTGWFPAFHGRNAMGGTYNNWLAGVKNPLRYTQADDIVRNLSKGKNLDKVVELGSKKFTYGELGEMMRNTGVLGQPGYLDVMRQVEEVISPKKGLKQILDIPKQGMEFIENRLRGALFIDRIAKGDEAWEAAKKVYRFHFDYAPEGLTTFEKQIMKRIIPFYTWTRNNVPLQISQIIEQPAKYAGTAKTLRALRGSTQNQREETEALPDYMQRGFPIRVGTEGKERKYIYGLGLPLQDLGELSLSQILSKTSPFIKTPLEQATNRHLYFDTPLDEVVYAPQIARKFPEPVKNWLEYTETQKSDGTMTRKVNPYKWHLVTSLLSRGLFTLDKLDDPEALGTIKLLYLTLGIKGKAVDIDKERYYRNKEAEEQTNKFLNLKGL